LVQPLRPADSQRGHPTPDRRAHKGRFGGSICPHLFRYIAVTELVDCAPEEIGIAPDLLGHADLQTTKKHYIQAVGMKAHARVQEMIAALRRAATSRDTTGTSRG
jgi:integrase